MVRCRKYGVYIASLSDMPDCECKNCETDCCMSQQLDASVKYMDASGTSITGSASIDSSSERGSEVCGNIEAEWAARNKGNMPTGSFIKHETVDSYKQRPEESRSTFRKRRWRAKAKESQEKAKSDHSHRIDIEIENGWGLIGSDAHIWPGELSTAQRAFIKFSADHYFSSAPVGSSPEFVCLNGDVFDGAKIGRWPSIGWEDKPTPIEELNACQNVLNRICGKRKIWTFGNHDWRFEKYFAQNAPEMRHMKGTHLKDWFPDWEPCWRLRINGKVNIKHRSSGNDPLSRGRRAGSSLITGHLHSLNVVRFTDYNGDHFSCDSGTLARCPGEHFVPQFTPWTEDNPVDWASGFLVLTFRNEQMLWPEVVHVIDEEKSLISFRGEVIHV